MSQKRHRDYEHYLSWWKWQPRPLVCEYCGRGPLSRLLPANSPLRATIDHRVSVARGGHEDPYKNGAVACAPCNAGKGSMSVEEWLAKLDEAPQPKAPEDQL